MYSRNEDIYIIVDAYSTGKSIVPLLINDSFKPICIHIKSSPLLPTSLQHNQSDFAYSLEHDGENVDNITSAIRDILGSKKIKFIIAGSESGIELTDRLNDIFHLLGNDYSKSHLRRNKFLMNEAVKEAGVQTVEQIVSNSFSSIIEWSTRLTQEAWPIVLKPVDSQSGDGVFFCNDALEIENAFGKITSTSNLFGKQNQEVLAQGYNEGGEFIINSVSYHGEHFPVEIWRIEKITNTTIYQYADLVDPTAEEFSSLFSATRLALNAVGTQYGAGTTEFKMHPKKGPVFLETTSRPMAGSPLAFIHKLLGYHQVSVMLEALLTPEFFMQKISRPLLSFSDDYYGLVVMLISDTEGIFQGELKSTFEHLETYSDCKLAIHHGEMIHVTIDSLTAPGEVYLLGKKEKVYQDYERIRADERNGLYRNAVIPNNNRNNSISGITFFENTLSSQQSTNLTSTLS